MVQSADVHASQMKYDTYSWIVEGISNVSNIFPTVTVKVSRSVKSLNDSLNSVEVKWAAIDLIKLGEHIKKIVLFSSNGNIPCNHESNPTVREVGGNP